MLQRKPDTKKYLSCLLLPHCRLQDPREVRHPSVDSHTAHCSTLLVITPILSSIRLILAPLPLCPSPPLQAVGHQKAWRRIVNPKVVFWAEQVDVNAAGCLNGHVSIVRVPQPVSPFSLKSCTQHQPQCQCNCMV